MQYQSFDFVQLRTFDAKSIGVTKNRVFLLFVEYIFREKPELLLHDAENILNIN